MSAIDARIGRVIHKSIAPLNHGLKWFVARRNGALSLWKDVDGSENDVRITSVPGLELSDEEWNQLWKSVRRSRHMPRVYSNNAEYLGAAIIYHFDDAGDIKGVPKSAASQAVLNDNGTWARLDETKTEVSTCHLVGSTFCLQQHTVTGKAATDEQQVTVAPAQAAVAAAATTGQDKNQ